MAATYPNAVTMELNPSVRALFTKIRDGRVQGRDFVHYSDRLLRLLVEFGLGHLPAEEVTIDTPVPGETFNGLVLPEDNVCAVTIIRAGDSMLQAVRDVLPQCAVGKILIQRDEETALPKLFYTKLPPKIATMNVVLCDPMLATGGSAITAIQCILDKGVPEEKIIFINLVSCPEGLAAIYEAHPKIMVICAAVDRELDGKKYICPGLGDFGDRYFGTMN